MKPIIIISVIFVIIISACAPATPQATLTPTLQPVETVTPTVTASPTPEPTPTATMEVDPYAIDMEKFTKAAPSYEYMVAHPEEFQAAPDLLSNPESFKDWYYNQYVPALLAGHEKKLPNTLGGTDLKRDVVNVYLQQYQAFADTAFGFEDTKVTPLSGELPIAYFMHEGVMYPILAFTINNGERGTDYNIGTYSVVLHPAETYFDGFDTIKNLYDGKGVKQIRLETIVQVDTPDTEIVQKFLNDGFNWQVDYQKAGPFFNIGIGVIKTNNK